VEADASLNAMELAFFPSPSPMEIMVIAVIALIVLGPSRLPEAARSLGKGLKEMRDSFQGGNDHEHEGDERLDEDLEDEDLRDDDLRDDDLRYEDLGDDADLASVDDEDEAEEPAARPAAVRGD